MYPDVAIKLRECQPVRDQSTIQTAVRLPRDVHERLKKSPAGVSEEIRQRLERTFAQDALDPVTRELLAAVLRLTGLISLDLGAAWHATPGANEALAAAVADLIAAYKPRGRAYSRGGAVTNALGLTKPEDQPDVIGRTLARHDRRANPSPYIEAAQRARFISKTEAGRRKLRARGQAS